jgi:hypothetical protein
VVVVSVVMVMVMVHVVVGVMVGGVDVETLMVLILLVVWMQK